MYIHTGPNHLDHEMKDSTVCVCNKLERLKGKVYFKMLRNPS